MRKHARVLFAVAALIIVVGGEALAVIGRPLTPMSYAGVARRTARRSAYAAPVVAAPAVATVAALPAGCAMAGGLYNCGAVHYRPYYDGPAVVYQAVP